MDEKLIKVYVQKIEQLTSTVKSFELAAVDGSKLPGFSAGSHIITRLNKQGEVIERRYSLTNSPKNCSSYTIAIRKQEKSKGGSLVWHEQIKEGDYLEISYPKNHFPLSDQAKKHLFYAMGIGITPFISMMKILKINTIPFELHYAAPSKEQCAFYKVLQKEFPNNCHFYFSSKGQRMQSSSMEYQPIGTHVYFCGSESMMKMYSEDAKNSGYSNQAIHYELFTPPQFGPTKPFVVELARSNKKIQVQSDETLLDSLLKHKIDAPFSCRVGSCGSCQLEVLNGSVEHRDSFLNEEEKKQHNCILTCVSRAKDRVIVLNL